MRKISLRTLAALAAGAAVATTASAQSNVTVYGKIDMGFQKDLGTSNKAIADAVGSRLGFKGSEDLGDGMSALFGIEARFDPSTGAATSNFWNGYSTVGLHTAYGTVDLGRQYVAAFSLIQNQLDPFDGETVGSLREIGLRLGIDKVRVAGSVRYDYSANGLNVAATLGESDKNGGPDRPYSVAANYTSGPLFLAAGLEKPAGASDKISSLGLRYDLKSVLLSAGWSGGTTTAGAKTHGYLVGAIVPIGAGQVRMGFAEQQQAGVTIHQKLAIGYHHWLSKRTKLYVDVANDSKLATEKSGYDLGINHVF